MREKRVVIWKECASAVRSSLLHGRQAFPVYPKRLHMSSLTEHSKATLRSSKTTPHPPAFLRSLAYLLSWGNKPWERLAQAFMCARNVVLVASSHISASSIACMCHFGLL
jgi:hypothetical protein